MRKVLWLALGFGAASGFCAYLRIPAGFAFPGVLLSAMILLFSRERNWFRKLGLMLLGAGLGVFWFSRFQSRVLEPVYELEGITRDVQIRCTGYGEETDYGIRVEGRTQISDRDYPVLVYLNEEISVRPGTLLSGPFQFQVTVSGGRKASTYYQAEGIFLLAYQKDAVTAEMGPGSWRHFPAELRRKTILLLETALPSDTAAFAKALLLGDSSDLSYETLTDFTVSGVRHIVAVSGLHVSVLVGLLSFLTFRKRWLSAVLGIPLLLLFAAVTGFTPSVSRACIMSGLMLLAALVNLEYDGPTALAFSGLVLLLINPLVITSVSYQLSFASVAGIFLFSPGIRKWLQTLSASGTVWAPVGKCIRQLSLSVSVTLGATAATLPLCALYFGTVSLAAVLTNLLVLWAVSLIFYGLMGLCLVGSFWMSGAVLLGKLISLVIRYVLRVTAFIGDFPLAAVYTRSVYITAWVVFVYILLTAFLLKKEKEPTVFVCCTVLSLCMALLLSWMEPARDDMRFTVLDVGQGQCLLMQTEGRNFLVDCGGSSDSGAADTAAETLLSQGISQLDGLILTHYDRDHAGGAVNLLSRIDVRLMILPPVYSELPLEGEYTVYAAEDLLITAGNTKIHIFTSENTGDSNENSLCILFDTKECDILVTGDRDGFGERMLLRRAQIPDVDVLVAGHHGSKYSTCEDLLAAVQPEIVCISAGAGNSFGHPAPELLQRLAQFGCSVYRTDLHGDIVIRR